MTQGTFFRGWGAITGCYEIQAVGAAVLALNQLAPWPNPHIRLNILPYSQNFLKEAQLKG